MAIAVVSSFVAIGALVVATCGVASVALISGGSAIVATSSAATAFEVATIASATAIGGAALYAVSETENSIMNAKSKSLSGRPELKKQGREGLEKRKTQKIGRKGLEKTQNSTTTTSS